MIPLRSTRARSARPFCRSLTSYSPKVYAYPFKLSPAQAIEHLRTMADPVTRFLKSFSSDQDSIKPKIVPVYFPAWFIDAEVEATVAAPTDRGTEDVRVTAVFTNSYLPGHSMPGHTMDRLSSISLLSPQLALNKPVPFSSDLETQHDTKITCLPFKTAPFSILDAAKSLRPNQCVCQNLRIDPSSIRTNLISAYPVLIPLYLAQGDWTFVGDDSQTAIVEAHHEMGRIIVENPADPQMRAEFVKNIPSSFRQMFDEFLYYRGSASNFGNISSLTIPPTWDIGEFHGFGDWLDDFMTAETLHQLVKTGDATMADPRVRPWTHEEIYVVRAFFSLGRERSEAQTFLKNQSKVPGNALQEVKEYAATLDANREQVLPSWWKDWQKSQKPNKPNMGVK
ncbi:hypothetical protein FB451DRAFT_1557682 [Mycena latifolia]|nr:hypothetical protein FB451DRAFT_1557682 [Mycena latifolia]